MQAIRSKDTKPELKVRRLLYAAGYRFRVHAKDLPGKPDIVFRGRRKAIQVHGCFWHLHPDPNCPDAKVPSGNNPYWSDKLRRNVERDQRTCEALVGLGFEVLVLWACQLEDDDLGDRLRDFIGPTRSR